MGIRFVTALLFLCMIQLSVFAQSEFSYTYNLENGLPSSYLKQIKQIEHGELFISSDNGLAVFDGYSFESFSTTHGLPSIYVKYVLFDKSGKLWVGTDGGLAVSESADPLKIKFKNFNLDPNNPNVKALRLFQDSKGRIWVASDQGIYVINDGRSQKLSFERPVRLLADFVRSFAFEEDKGGNIWITSLGEGLFVYQNEGSQLKQLNLPGLSKITRSIYKYSDNIFWIGTADGMYQLEPNIANPYLSATKLILSKPLFIDVITKASNELYFLGTDGFGYSTYNPISGEVKKGEPLSSEYVKDIFIDRLKNVWIGTDDGLTLLPYTPFDNISTKQGLPKRYVSGTIEDKMGNVWISTYEGMFKRSAGSQIVTKTPSSMNGLFIKVIIYDSKSDMIYVFTQQEIYSLNPKNSSTQLLGKVPSQYQIENAYIDSDQQLWLATTTASVFRLNLTDRSLDLFDKKNGINVPIKAIQKSANGSLLFSGNNRMLLNYNSSTSNFSQFDWTKQDVKADSLSTFDCLTLDQWNRMWIGGTDGIYWLDQAGKVSKPNIPADLDLSNLRFMVGRGVEFWIGTNRFLYLINLDDNGNIIKVRGFNKKDGLISTSFSYRSGFYSESGRFWMGTNLAVSYYTGQKFQEKLEPLKLNWWKANETEYHTTEMVELEPGNNNVTFKVVCMNYPTDEILYQTRLVGLNDSWSTPSKNRYLSMTLTGSGDYEMQARAITKGGLETETLSIKFTIPPPMWLRWWAIAFYIIVGGGGIISFVQYRSKALQKRNKELEDFVAQRTAEIMKRDQELTEILSVMDQKGSLLSKESIRLNQNITTMTASSVQQSSAVAQTTATMEELAQSNKMIEFSAGKVSRMMNETKQVIETGTDRAEKSSDHMLKIQAINEEQVRLVHSLAKRAETIRNVASFVENINDQTQLIAFNAAIEATVSGEVGRRFKVIADEIRELANEINGSTKEINKNLNDMIEEISEVVKMSNKNKISIDEGVKLISEVTQNFNDIFEAAGQVNELTENISNSTSQQSVANGQMVTSLREIGDASNHLVEIIRDISETSQQMEQTAKYFLEIKQ